jgi:hypothetical protein
VRTVVINGAEFEVRGLRLSEVGKKGMRKLGYGRFAFKPDLGDGDVEERLGEIMDEALLAVLGKDGYEAVDQAGGVQGLREVWQAIIAETYGTRDEEKNSSGAGSGSAIPGAVTTATPAGEPTAAAGASTDSLPG